MSTIHQATIARTGKTARDGAPVSKLVLVNAYNKNMGGVDRNDALIGNYSSVRKTLKWTTKVAFHFIEEAVLNAFILYNKTNPDTTRFLQFKLNIIQRTINRAKAVVPEFNLPIIGRHFLQLIPPSNKKANPQKRCMICAKKGIRKESRYQCKNCIIHPGLCPAPCFEEFHTAV